MNGRQALFALARSPCMSCQKAHLSFRTIGCLECTEYLPSTHQCLANMDCPKRVFVTCTIHNKPLVRCEKYKSFKRHFNKLANKKIKLENGLEILL